MITADMKNLKSSIGKETKLHYLEARPDTVHWGYFSKDLEPVLEVNSGDLVYAETITHHAGYAPDLLLDDASRAIYESIPYEERNPGSHLLTGPIYVKDAKPGDTLQVDILKLEPRMPYGSNVAAPWGHLFKDFNEKTRVVIYELDKEEQWLTAKFAYDYPGAYTVRGKIIEPDTVNRVPALENMQIPARYHIGTLGVCPAEDGKISTIPPGLHGGNIDNWRIGEGATMYYPVFNEGGLLSIGDCHLAQGDSELDGTAVEASMNCLVRITLRKDFGAKSPILETATTWVAHGFDVDLNQAMRKASLEGLNFIQKYYGLSAEDAYSFMSVAADFGVTQVVDHQLGIHVSIPKNALKPNRS